MAVNIPNYLVLYPTNSAVIVVSGLKDQLSNAYINNATASATLTDRTGVEIAGLIDIQGIYQTGSNGIYEFPIDPETFTPVTGGGYTLLITAVTPGGAQYLVKKPVVVKVRNKGTEV